MFALQFNRILWKEYRFQRTLWLSCLLIGALFEIVLVYSSTDVEHRGETLVRMSQMIAIMYAVGCGAVLFASEREERTCDWLLCLSAMPGPILAAKILFAVASTAVLQLVLSCPSIVLNVVMFPYGDRFSAPWEAFLPVGLVVLIWSILGSLISRRVMASIVAMGLWWAVTFLFPLLLTQWLWMEFFGRRFDADLSGNRNLILFGVSALIAMEIWIGWQWCQGRYWDGSSLEALNSRSTSWWNQLTSRTASATRIPARAEYEQPWRRTCQRLMWQERHRESLQWLLLTVGCAMGVLMAIMPPSTEIVSTMIDLSWLVILAIPIAMGVLGFSSDSNSQQPRFLCNRGLSPASVWLVKQVIWMPRAFWITGVVFFIACYFEQRIGISGVGLTKSFQVYCAENYRQPAIAIWYILLAFGCGQLSAMLFQRVVLASVFGILMASCVGGWWLPANVYLGVPLWWSQGIPVATMLAISLWQMKTRMLEDQSWSHRGKLIAVIVGTLVMLVTALAGYRIAEVATLPRMYPERAGQWHASLTIQQQAESYTSDEAFVSSQIDRFRRRPVAEDSATADEVVELMKRDLKALDVPFMSQRATDVWTLTKIVARRADDYTREGQYDKALECYLASLKLARTSAMRGRLSGMWKRESSIQSIVLETIVNWTNRPSLTPEFIREAIKSIELELAKFPSAAAAVTATYLYDRKIVEFTSITDLAAYQIEGGHLIGHPEVFGITLFLPWERWRLEIQMAREAEILYAQTSELEQRLASNQNLAELAEVIREGSTYSPYDPKKPESESRHVSTMFSICGKNVLHRQTEIRSALVRMGLIAYRRENDRLPERLADLMETINEVNLIDPWSGRLFDYYPTFLLSAGEHNAAVVPVSSTSVEIKNDPNLKLGPIDYRQITSSTNVAPSAWQWKILLNLPDYSNYLISQTPMEIGSPVFPIPEKLRILPEH